MDGLSALVKDIPVKMRTWLATNSEWLGVTASIVAIAGVPMLFAGGWLMWNDISAKLQPPPDPELVCILDSNPGSEPRDGVLLFTLKNQGSIDASTVSVGYWTLRYDKKLGKIRIGGAGGGLVYDYNPLGVRWMYAPEIKPNEVRRKETTTMSILLPDFIEVQVFEVSFFRAADGRGYTKRCDYFVENGRIQNRARFRSHELFETVDSEVSRWMSPDMKFFRGDLHEHLKQ